MKISGPGTGYHLPGNDQRDSRPLQSNTGYYNCPWLPTLSTWSDPTAEDTKCNLKMAQNVFLLPSFSSVKSCCEGFLGRKNTNGPSHIKPPTPFAHMSSSYVMLPPRGYPVDNPTPVPQQRVLHPCLSPFSPVWCIIVQSYCGLGFSQYMISQLFIWRLVSKKQKPKSSRWVKCYSQSHWSKQSLVPSATRLRVQLISSTSCFEDPVGHGCSLLPSLTNRVNCKLFITKRLVYAYNEYFTRKYIFI